MNVHLLIHKRSSIIYHKLTQSDAKQLIYKSIMHIYVTETY